MSEQKNHHKDPKKIPKSHHDPRKIPRPGYDEKNPDPKRKNPLTETI